MPNRWFAQSLTIFLLAVLATVLFAPILTVVQGGFEEDGEFSLVWFDEIRQELIGAVGDRYESLKLAVLPASWLSDEGSAAAELTFDMRREYFTEVITGTGGNLYGNGLINSLVLAVLTTGLCLVISLPLAMLAENFDFRGKRIWLALVQVPLILPPFVGAIGMKKLLSRNGGINALLSHFGIIDPAHPIDWLAQPFWACVVLEALYLYPIIFLNVQAALANIDPALDEAARNLGAGPWRRFRRVTLPLMRPGVFAGSTIVFIWSFTELGTPLMVGFNEVTAVQVFSALQTTNPGPDTYALVMVLLCVSVGIYALGKFVFGRPVAAMLAKATVATPPRKLGRLGTLLVTLPFALVFFLAFLPHISVVLGSISTTGMLEVVPSNLTLQHHIDAVGHPIAGRSVVNSLKYSIIATAADIVIAFVIAYLLVRCRTWGSSLLDALAMLPLAVPGLVLAFGFFAVTQGDSIVGFLNPLENDPTPLLVIAYAVRRLPFLVRSCVAGLEQTSVALEEAAVNLGASTPRVLWKVTIPLLTANLIAGSLLVFSRSMLEVSDSLILAFDDHTYPMTKAIWSFMGDPAAGAERASALGVWGMILLIVTISGASLALGKRLGALFRV